MFKAIFGDSDSRFVKKHQAVIKKINELEKDFEALSAEECKAKTAEFKERLQKGETPDDLLPEAFALAREAAKRTLGQRHYDVQLLGGIALHQGNISEMMTGEGKTLVATLPVYLNALTGKGVHVVTVNDYLTSRDAVWMGQIYDYLGLSVGCLNHQTSYLYDPTHTEADASRDEVGGFKVFHEFLRPATRQAAYAADITYGTNHEYGFDYLRDNLVHSPSDLVQRGHHFAIVDEIDSILIDEARTPLIISSASEDSSEFYKTFARIAKTLTPETDYTTDEKHKSIALTEAGINKAEKMLGVSDIYTEKGVRYVHHLETAVRARAIFLLDRDYVVRDGEIVIVDPFTGRLMPGRRWSEGLHQAVEAKEGVAIQKESRTIASITFQNYFRFYTKLAGMTGTAKTSEEEFLKVYNLPVISIPTNVLSARRDEPDIIFQTERGKFKALARKVKELNKKGQPVLLGTVSIEKNELLGEYLRAEGVPYEILNAKNHEREGEIIAQAGRRGAVTVATNLAGRGVDIKLGGNPTTKESSEEVKNLGGLYVIGTERHEARRIDNQLRGRAGRQGDPGATRFFVSLEDDLLRIFGADRIKGMMARFNFPEDEPIEANLIGRALENAQEKVEGFHFDNRKHTLAYDDVLNLQRKTVYERRRKVLSGDRDEIDVILNETFFRKEELLSEKMKQFSTDDFYLLAQRIILSLVDLLWMEHLETMDYLRSSVNLRAYGQHDPLVEYKKEGLRLYKEMQRRFEEHLLHMLMEAKGVPVETKSAEISHDKEFEGAGRNDPCPCGSGKKFKKCHGA
jgi:preprotein translocase subunit SecA